MSVDFGIDISTFPDLDPSFTPISGQRVVAEALARRLMTPRGTLIDAPNYGTDIRRWLNESFMSADLLRVKAAIEAECKNDERVRTAVATVTLDTLTPQTLRIALQVTTNAGPFALVLAITAVNVTILGVR